MGLVNSVTASKVMIREPSALRKGLPRDHVLNSSSRLARLVKAFPCRSCRTSQRPTYEYGSTVTLSRG